MTGHHNDVVELLLKHPCIDVNAFSRSGLLIWSESDGEMDVGASTLTIAAAYGNVKATELLIKHPRIEVKQQQGSVTPLLLAALKGHLGVVELLLAHPDTDPNISEPFGFPPVFFAAREGHRTQV